MKKAVFVPMENKKDQQVAFDAALSPKERVARMFELIDLSLAFQKKYIPKPLRPNTVVLKRKNVAL